MLAVASEHIVALGAVAAFMSALATLVTAISMAVHRSRRQNAAEILDGRLMAGGRKAIEDGAKVTITLSTGASLSIDPSPANVSGDRRLEAAS